jgi:hypothetical protein
VRCKVARRIGSTGKPVRAAVDFAGRQGGYRKMVEVDPQKSLRAGARLGGVHQGSNSVKSLV